MNRVGMIAWVVLLGAASAIADEVVVKGLPYHDVKIVNADKKSITFMVGDIPVTKRLVDMTRITLWGAPAFNKAEQLLADNKLDDAITAYEASFKGAKKAWHKTLAAQRLAMARKRKALLAKAEESDSVRKDTPPPFAETMAQIRDKRRKATEGKTCEQTRASLDGVIEELEKELKVRGYRPRPEDEFDRFLARALLAQIKGIDKVSVHLARFDCGIATEADAKAVLAATGGQLKEAAKVAYQIDEYLESDDLWQAVLVGRERRRLGEEAILVRAQLQFHRARALGDGREKDRLLKGAVSSLWRYARSGSARAKPAAALLLAKYYGAAGDMKKTEQTLAYSWLSDAQRAEVLLEVARCAGKIADPDKARKAAAKARALLPKLSDPSTRARIDALLTVLEHTTGIAPKNLLTDPADRKAMLARFARGHARHPNVLATILASYGRRDRSPAGKPGHCLGALLRVPVPTPPNEKAFVDFLEIRTRAANVVYVIDRSASMVANFDVVATQMVASVANLTPRQNFHILFFAAHQPVESRQRKSVSASMENKIKAVDLVNKVIPEGKTDPIPALIRAFQVVQKDKGGARNSVIFFLTDGDLPDSKRLLDVIRKYHARIPVRIYPILFEYEGKHAIAVMKQIAEQTKGEFKHVKED